MTRIFRKKGRSGGGAGDDDHQHDDMTITSGWSMGGNSVSDRILGRVKKNLSFRQGGGSSNHPTNSSASVGSLKSTDTGNFGRSRRRAGSRDQNLHETFSLDGEDRRNGLLRNNSSSRRFRSAGQPAPSSATVEAMEEMDSVEAMMLHGKTMGRRRNALSSPPRRSQRKPNHANEVHDAPKPDGDDEPVEYSLADLRSMEGGELERVMRKAGVPSEDISNTLAQAAKVTHADDMAEDQRKNLLVALFVNSGHVKLVSRDSVADRRPTTASLASFSMRDSALSSAGSVGAMEEIEGSVKSSRKSKLAKIAELKTENSDVKRENKSLKKTVKKLLGQLSEAAEEKERLQKALDDAETNATPKETADDSFKTSLHSIGEADGEKGDEKRPQDAGNTESTSATSGEQPPFDVVVHADDKQSTRVEEGSRRSSSDKNMAKNVAYLKRKLKKEKEAHVNTEFRLKAEVDILTKEVDGLQRELGLSLESLDKAKKRARQSREAASNLKHDLRNATSKAKELTAEAEARDKLIESFTKILLQRAGVEGGRGGGDDEGLEGGSLKDALGLEQIEESIAELKRPT
ncbi:hypothetical protein ACHAWF_017829 [Thalassiosira exigua]